jgi:hypothetical protein
MDCFRQKCAVVQDSLSCYAIICSFASVMQFAVLPRTLCLSQSFCSLFRSLLLTRLRSLVSFSQLQRQIIDLATTHFVHLPVRPPAEDLAQVPSNLPSFLGDTIAARYVQAILNSLDLHLTLS